MPNLQRLLDTQAERTALFPITADPPSATTQRLQAILTGSLPTFVEAAASFGAEAVREDNLLAQLVAQGKRAVQLGDDTWMALLPDGWSEAHPYPSFNVMDIHTVDEGVLRHLPELLSNRSADWDVLIGHFLGVDHIGHRFGPNHPALPIKLAQLDSAIQHVVDTMPDDAVLIVLGDHGMTGDGNHGGASNTEVSTALWMHSPAGVWAPETALEQRIAVQDHNLPQIALLPTLCYLLGLPTPFQSVAPVLPGIAYHAPGSDDVDVSRQASRLVAHANVAQILRYLQAYAAEAPGQFESLLALEAGRLAELARQPLTSDATAQMNQLAVQLYHTASEYWTQFHVHTMAAGVWLLVVLCVSLAARVAGPTQLRGPLVKLRMLSSKRALAAAVGCALLLNAGGSIRELSRAGTTSCKILGLQPVVPSCTWAAQWYATSQAWYDVCGTWAPAWSLALGTCSASTAEAASAAATGPGDTAEPSSAGPEAAPDVLGNGWLREVAQSLSLFNDGQQSVHAAHSFSGMLEVLASPIAIACVWLAVRLVAQGMHAGTSGASRAAEREPIPGSLRGERIAGLPRNVAVAAVVLVLLLARSLGFTSNSYIENEAPMLCYVLGAATMMLAATRNSRKASSGIAKPPPAWLALVPTIVGRLLLASHDAHAADTGAPQEAPWWQGVSRAWLPSVLAPLGSTGAFLLLTALPLAAATGAVWSAAARWSGRYKDTAQVATWAAVSHGVQSCLLCVHWLLPWQALSQAAATCALVWALCMPAVAAASPGRLGLRGLPIDRAGLGAPRAGGASHSWENRWGETLERSKSARAVAAGIVHFLPVLALLQSAAGVLPFYAAAAAWLCIISYAGVMQATGLPAWHSACAALQWVCLEGLLFASTGHTSQFSSIQFRAGFIGSDAPAMVRAGAQVMVNTLGSSILAAACFGLFAGASRAAAKRSWPGTPRAHSAAKDGSVVGASTVWAVLSVRLWMLTMCCLYTLIARRHLMVWAIFAPKFCAELLSAMPWLVAAAASALAQRNMQKRQVPW